MNNIIIDYINYNFNTINNNIINTINTLIILL